jgi:hypothetical protein
MPLRAPSATTDGDHPPYQRVLFRKKIKLGWLTRKRGE